MIRKYLIFSSLLMLTASGCGPAVPLWRYDAKLVLDRVRLDGASNSFPEEFMNAENAMHEGDARMQDGKVEEADRFFHLSWMEGRLLEEKLESEKARHEEELKRKAEEQRELERQKAMQEERRLTLLRARESAARTEAKKREKARQNRVLSSYHTVKRGETLPLIAAQSDVYNDPALWPLLYRGNRDQIRDPRHLWPGQVLRIPRNLTLEDLAEARRYAKERAIY